MTEESNTIENTETSKLSPETSELHSELADIHNATNSELMEDVYDSVQRVLVSKKVTPSNVVVITTQMMVVVQRYPELTGPMKKRMVLTILERLVDEHSQDMDPDDVVALKLIISVTVPEVIDAVKNAFHKKIDLKKIRTWCGNLCGKN